MRRQYYYLICLVLSIVMPKGLLAQEMRAGVKYQTDLNEKLELDIDAELRQYIGSKNESAQLMQAKLSYDLLKCWSASSSIRYSHMGEVEKKDELSLIDNDKIRLTSDIIYKSHIKGKDFRISNRLRFQFSESNIHKEKKYIRNKVSFDYKLNKNFNSNIAIEPYYSIRKRSVTNFRIYMGGEFDVFHNKIEVFGIMENNMDLDNFETYHIIGFTYKIK